MKDLCDSQGHRVQFHLVEDDYENVGSGVQRLPCLGGGVMVQAPSDREE